MLGREPYNVATGARGKGMMKPIDFDGCLFSAESEAVVESTPCDDLEDVVDRVGLHSDTATAKNMTSNPRVQEGDYISSNDNQVDLTSDMIYGGQVVDDRQAVSNA